MELKIGDKVELIVMRQSQIGFSVLINEEFEGMLYKNELYQKIAEGQRLVGFIKKIRDDEKIDVSLNPIGFKRTVVTNEIKILNALKQHEGFIALNDKSSPEDIKFKLGMSKKAFKNAVGGLFRQKLITISNEGIRSV